MSNSNIVLILCLAMTSFVFAKIVVHKKASTRTNEPYTLMKSTDSYEIRQYKSAVVAGVDLGSGDYKSLSNVGFRKLAGYIFGGNEEKKKIAMTSPVMMDLGETSSMYFFMPEGYDLENLPKPNNREVLLQELDSKRVAVIQFGGWANQEKIDTHRTKLASLLKEEGISHTGEFFFLGYNAPFDVTNRRNEVMVVLNGELNQ